VILKFAVNGAECTVHAHPDDRLGQCVDIAFTCTRYTRNYGYHSAHDGEPMGWEVRNAGGVLLDESTRVGDVPRVNEIIYVNLPAGSGA